MIRLPSLSMLEGETQQKVLIIFVGVVVIIFVFLVIPMLWNLFVEEFKTPESSMEKPSSTKVTALPPSKAVQKTPSSRASPPPPSPPIPKATWGELKDSLSSLEQGTEEMRQDLLRNLAIPEKQPSLELSSLEPTPPATKAIHENDGEQKQDAVNSVTIASGKIESSWLQLTEDISSLQKTEQELLQKLSHDAKQFAPEPDKALSVRTPEAVEGFERAEGWLHLTHAFRELEQTRQELVSVLLPADMSDGSQNFTFQEEKVQLYSGAARHTLSLADQTPKTPDWNIAWGNIRRSESTLAHVLDLLAHP